MAFHYVLMTFHLLTTTGTLHLMSQRHWSGERASCQIEGPSNSHRRRHLSAKEAKCQKKMQDIFNEIDEGGDG